ncbi:MAG TPA: DUF2231 domain-containing protein [bacterium]|nr:DUF2231 domain-containing protein [bacterium]
MSRQILIASSALLILSAAAILSGPAGALAHEGGEGAPFLDHLINFLGQFHVMIVHFPIALIMAAGLAEILGLIFKKEFYFAAARFIVVIAALSAIPTVLLGAAAEHGSDFTGPYADIVETHEGLGITTMVITIIAAALSELWRRREDARLKILYRVALFAAMAAVTVTGHFGGELVHGIGYWKW